MTDRMRETMDGNLGHFWTELSDVYDLNKSKDGYVRLVDDNLFHVSTLRTREFPSEIGRNTDRLPRPEAIYAMTASARSIFFDIAGISRRSVCTRAVSRPPLSPPRSGSAGQLSIACSLTRAASKPSDAYRGRVHRQEPSPTLQGVGAELCAVRRSVHHLFHLSLFSE
jgi:hypothetical protein